MPIQPALSGVQLRRGDRQSIPSSSIANWAAVAVAGTLTYCLALARRRSKHVAPCVD